MHFNIVTDKGNYKYDNVLNTVSFGNSDSLIDYSALAEIIPAKHCNDIVPFDFTDEKYPYPKKDKKIRHLKIQVGTNCNYKCAYCIQAMGNYKEVPVAKKDDIDRFFDLLDNSDVELLPKAKIHLWGGEPLVYWKALIYLIPELRKRYPESEIWFVSNGSLLTEDKLQFLLEHKVDLSFSHDGPAYFLRGKDPLDDKNLHALWIRAKELYAANNLSFSINAVINQYNADLYQLDSFLVNKFGEDIQYKYEDTVIVHSENAVNYIYFPKKAQQALESSVLRAVLEKDAASQRVNAALYSRLLDMLQMLVYRIPSTIIKARCNAADFDVLSVDLQGNVISCHNVSVESQTLGTLLEYNAVKVNKFKHWSLRSNCPSCPYLISCKGNCIRNSDFLHNQGCASKKALGHALFKACWFLLNGSIIKEITYDEEN